MIPTDQRRLGGYSQGIKTWADWKIRYKRAHAKARVKAQAAEGSDNFGATNVAERVLKNSKVSTENGGNKVVMKSLEGYFENLVDDAINKKSVLEKLVANNAKLSATNKDLVVIVKKIPTRIGISNERPTASRKQAAAGQHKGRGTQPCVPISKRMVIMNIMAVLNSRRTRTSARPVGKAACDVVGPSAKPSLVNLK